MIPNKRAVVFILYLVSCCSALLYTGCAPRPRSSPLQFISNWDELTNPIFERDDAQITSVDAHYDRGTWFLFYSILYEDSSGTHARIEQISTKDFKNYSAPILSFNGQEDGWLGMANPSIIKLRNIYYLSFNSWGDKPGKPDQLFYMSSRDLRNWTVKAPLAPELTFNEKATYPVLAFSRGKWFLCYNHNREPRVAMTRGIRMPFERLGMGNLSLYSSADTILAHQKHQPISFGNKWGLLASGNKVDPYLYKLPTSGSSGLGWLTWDGGYPIKVIRRELSQAPPPESATLINMKSAGGYFYLFYVMSPSGETSLQSTTSKIEVYRSIDLQYWTPAGR